MSKPFSRLECSLLFPEPHPPSVSTNLLHDKGLVGAVAFSSTEVPKDSPALEHASETNRLALGQLKDGAAPHLLVGLRRGHLSICPGHRPYEGCVVETAGCPYWCAELAAGGLHGIPVEYFNMIRAYPVARYRFSQREFPAISQHNDQSYRG